MVIFFQESICMGAWINKKANSIATCYLKKTGQLLDSGERPFDARMAFWILEKIARSPGKRNVYFWNDEVQELEEAIREKREHPALTDEGYIGTQVKLKSFAFGDRGNTADHGCGWVAVFNVWRLLGKPRTPTEIAGEVGRGARGHGRRGVDPFFILKYFRAYGYEAEMTTGREAMENAAERADAYILCYLYSNPEGMIGGHFIAGHWDKEKCRHLIYNGEHGGRETVGALREAPCEETLLNMLISIKKAAPSEQLC